MSDNPTPREPMSKEEPTGGDDPAPRPGPAPPDESPWAPGAAQSGSGARPEDEVAVPAWDTTPAPSGAVPPPPPPVYPPPAWQDPAPGGGEPHWDWAPAPEPAGAPLTPPARRRLNPMVMAAITGALVGALVAGILVTVFDRETATDGFPAATFAPNTSRIDRSADIQEILARVQPAVVSIRTRTLNLGELLRPLPGQGAGTGIVISDDGVIVTNAHVVSGAQSIEVVFGNDRTMPARVLGRDSAVDLAVLKVDAAGLAAAVLGDSDRLRVGDDVVAIGNALALQGGPTVTRGIVSAKDRTITAENGVSLEHLIQTDTAINPGNSGGPLVNSDGEVVGINTAVAGGAQNIGFAIAITEAKPIIEELREGTATSRPFLGVQMYDVDRAVAGQLDLSVDEGALVAAVTAGSAAEVGGIRRLDVIVAIDGKDVARAEDVTAEVRRHKPGDEIDVTVVRDGERRTFRITLGERPADVG